MNASLRPGLIVAYDLKIGGCDCRWELVVPVGGWDGGWDARCVAACFQHHFVVGYAYHLKRGAISYDHLAAGLEERFA